MTIDPRFSVPAAEAGWNRNVHLQHSAPHETIPIRQSHAYYLSFTVILAVLVRQRTLPLTTVQMKKIAENTM